MSWVGWVKELKGIGVDKAYEPEIMADVDIVGGKIAKYEVPRVLVKLFNLVKERQRDVLRMAVCKANAGIGAKHKLV